MKNKTVHIACGLVALCGANAWARGMERSDAIEPAATRILNGSVVNGNFGTVIGAGDLKNDSYGDLVVVEPGYANGQATEGRVFVRSGEW
jgi:hypothetical protein